MNTLVKQKILNDFDFVLNSCDINCDDGWFLLIYEMLNKLKKIKCNDYSIYKITQEKGKLKVLTISEFGNEKIKKIGKIINYYEKLSYGICETCGCNTGISLRKIDDSFISVCYNCFVKMKGY